MWNQELTENVALREDVDRFSLFEEIVGSCEPMRQVLKQVTKVAPSDSTILILGETGTSKELIASAYHRRSNRATRTTVRVNRAQNLVSVCSSLRARDLTHNQAARQPLSYKPIVLCNMGDALGACVEVRGVL